MYDGPWLITRSPIPRPRTTSGSMWIGLGSCSSAAMVFMRSGRISRRSMGSAAPGSIDIGGLPARQDEDIGDGGDLRAAVELVQVIAERHQVERAGLAALLALDAHD